jgi:hypothetical protein
MISLALQIIHLGNSKKHFLLVLVLIAEDTFFSVIISLIFLMFWKGYQREKHKGDKEEVSNITAPNLQQTTLSWTLSDFRKEHGTQEGWWPQDSPPNFKALEEREFSAAQEIFAVILISALLNIGSGKTKWDKFRAKMRNSNIWSSS